jgi:hypothetical protein
LRKGLTIKLQRLHLKRCGNFNTIPDGAGDRTKIGMKAVDSFSRFALFGRQEEGVSHMDPLDNQDVALFLNFTACF